MVSGKGSFSASGSTTPAPACNGRPKNFVMFFAAERELQQKRRRKSEELRGQLSFVEDTGIAIGGTLPPKSPVRALDAVYPDFTSTRTDDVIRIVSDIEALADKPATKKQKTSDGRSQMDRVSSFISHQKSKNTHVTPQSFDELVKLFPQLQTILDEQQHKLESRRVADQYIHEVEKPKLTLPQAPQETTVSKKEETGTWQPNFAVDSTKPLELPPHPTGIGGSVTAANVGGGLLSGIDDLFGSPKKKTRSKRR